jgi:hypothetical protein
MPTSPGLSLEEKEFLTSWFPGLMRSLDASPEAPGLTDDDFGVRLAAPIMATGVRLFL